MAFGPSPGTQMPPPDVLEYAVSEDRSHKELAAFCGFVVEGFGFCQGPATRSLEVVQEVSAA